MLKELLEKLVAGSVRGCQATLDGVSSRFRAIGTTSLAEDILHVIDSSVVGNEEHFGYLAIALTRSDEAKYFHFSLGQTIWVS